jgi:hypothetical protein
LISLLAWVSRNAPTDPHAAAAAELFRSGKWDGQSLRTLQITIATKNLWHSHVEVLKAVTAGFSTNRPKAAYQYTLLVPDDDDPVVLERAEIYKVGDIIPLTFVEYQVVGGRCTLDCGPFSHFVLDCCVLHS